MMAPRIKSPDKMIVMQRFTIKIILMTEGEI